MKILNTMLGRQAIAAALVLSLAIPMSVGAFAEEPAAAAAADDTVVAGYLPPQDESVMLQGEIALHSGDVAVGETDPAYGGYGAPEGDPIQGDIMLISADEAKTTEARYTVKGLLGPSGPLHRPAGGPGPDAGRAGLCRHLPRHHSGHEDSDGAGRIHAGAHHREGFHHPEPFPAVRGPDRHPAGCAPAAGRQRFPDGRPALPPRPHRGPLSGLCSPFLKLNKTQQERSAGMTRWGAPAVFGIYQRMSNFTAHSA